MRRVVVTGIGVICGLGNNREEFDLALRQGRCGIGPITNAECLDLRFQNGGEVKGFDANDHFAPKEADMIDRFAQFGQTVGNQFKRLFVHHP